MKGLDHDMIAYEAYRWHHDSRDKPCKNRPVMNGILDHNGISERYYGAYTLLNLKAGIESTICNPNRLTVLPNPLKY